MKKNLMTKCKVVAVMGLAVICLVACKGNNEDDKAIETTIAVENETKYDVDAKIAAAKSEADVIEKKLTEDGSLTQTEMNQLATELYTIWDNTMNDMYNVLKDTPFTLLRLIENFNQGTHYHKFSLTSPRPICNPYAPVIIL